MFEGYKRVEYMRYFGSRVQIYKRFLLLQGSITSEENGHQTNEATSFQFSFLPFLKKV